MRVIPPSTVKQHLLLVVMMAHIKFCYQSWKIESRVLRYTQVFITSAVSKAIFTASIMTNLDEDKESNI